MRTGYKTIVEWSEGVLVLKTLTGGKDGRNRVNSNNSINQNRRRLSRLRNNKITCTCAKSWEGRIRCVCGDVEVESVHLLSCQKEVLTFAAVEMC